ncbi:MAG TPA: hypothetical protein VK701_08670 [Solirubrobacteraceae bacterium]|nr:hypothetical protein [Solirubrobacteraceae bacterium]
MKSIAGPLRARIAAYTRAHGAEAKSIARASSDAAREHFPKAATMTLASARRESL